MYVIGNKDVAHTKDCRFWAERGLIHCEDSRDNSYQSYSVRTVLERINALNEMVGNSRADRKGFMFEDQIRDLQNFIDTMAALCKKAQEQGQPMDESARRDLVRRMPKTVVMPSAAAMF